MSIQDAFFQVCNEAQPASPCYVSLYVNTPFYGGPEEGGWWGHDSHLLAYEKCQSEEEASAKREKVLALAEELNREALREYGEYCQRTMDWLENAGQIETDSQNQNRQCSAA